MLKQKRKTIAQTKRKVGTRLAICTKHANLYAYIFFTFGEACWHGPCHRLRRIFCSGYILFCFLYPI